MRSLFLPLWYHANAALSARVGVGNGETTPRALLERLKMQPQRQPPLCPMRNAKSFIIYRSLASPLCFHVPHILVIPYEIFTWESLLIVPRIVPQKSRSTHHVMASNNARTIVDFPILFSKASHACWKKRCLLDSKMSWIWSSAQCLVTELPGWSVLLMRCLTLAFSARKAGYFWSKHLVAIFIAATHVPCCDATSNCQGRAWSWKTDPDRWIVPGS